MSTESKVIIFGGILTVVVVAGISVFLSKDPSSDIPEGEIISRTGIHWHPNLSIYIKDKQQEIPTNFGIGAVHLPIHTHDSSGTLHLEMNGVVTKDRIKVGSFFRLWGKEFSSTQIFDKKNGEEGVVKMTVNGRENKDFESYLMRDGDKIEIRYE